MVELCRKHAAFEQAAYNAEGKSALLKEAIFAKAPKLFCFVVEKENVLVGYYTFTFDFSTWQARPFLHLDCLYLEPEARGMRIGERIFDHLRQLAKAHNCVNIQWQTPSFNERAIKFYNRMGGLGRDKVRFSLDVG